MSTKALIYCRVSSDRQAKEGHGLDSQEHRCREYALQKGYEVEKVFRDSFSGGGDFMKRPAMVELLKYADQNGHKNYAVIFDDLSRFARDIMFHFKLKAEFKVRDLTPVCLNFDFDDTPEGEVAEGFFALQHQYHRKSNARQVIQKTVARMEKGYWANGAPPGYYMAKDPMHGKLLKRKEPEATIIQEALEGYASCRFERLVDVVNFLRAKNYGGRPIYIEGVRRLLRRVVYAGYIERPWRNVQRTKGHHEGLISLETFELIQARLEGRYKVRTRSTDRIEFILRGFVCCSECMHPMTASWSQGRKQRHRYYRCHKRGCVRFNKSINGDVMDEKFEALLRSVVPQEKVVRLTKAVLLDLWQAKLKDIDSHEASIERQLVDTIRT